MSEQHKNTPTQKLSVQSESADSGVRRVLVLLDPPERGWAWIEQTLSPLLSSPSPLPLQGGADLTE